MAPCVLRRNRVTRASCGDGGAPTLHRRRRAEPRLPRRAPQQLCSPATEVSPLQALLHGASREKKMTLGAHEYRARGAGGRKNWLRNTLSKICMHEAARLKCHKLRLSHPATNRAKACLYTRRCASPLHSTRQRFAKVGACFWPMPSANFWAFISRLSPNCTNSPFKLALSSV